MRKIAITGVTAALAFGLTACGGDGKPAAAPPASAPAGSAPAPSDTAKPGAAKPGAPSTPGDSGSTGTPTVRNSPPAPQQIRSKWGRLRYLAPGKFTVGNVAFFTSDRTVLIVAGGTCPDGSTPTPNGSECGIEGLEDWAKAAPHNVNVRFSGQTATVIQETQ